VNDDRRSPSLIAYRTIGEQEFGAKQNRPHPEQPECVAGHWSGRGSTAQATDQDAGRQQGECTIDQPDDAKGDASSVGEAAAWIAHGGSPWGSRLSITITITAIR
jgi:hypothetical protein